ncbi:uncharacterized protein LOC26534683 [Drosophila yakuba]|uniref:Uncharacterized protein, isoform A n=1 Tax=Drosophila yakuba TaxID=7245 RepID=A0A0R1DVI4_DROYA|nr:uncharacterized protein LOC26534683 [Drosophila yakuba]KRJ99842.1 uncharacterized protein Dyak_GE27502, isoform A [Drosophila yakuba]
MAILLGCCYFFGPRTGCIIGSFWIILYYSLMAYFMHYQMVNSQRATIDFTTREYEKKTRGFWVLGISFIVMACVTLLLLLGAILKKYEFLFLFLLAQIPPISVESFYLLTAMMYGLEFESFVIYLLPLGILIYIDLVVCSYFYELKSLKRLRAVSEFNIEY